MYRKLFAVAAILAMLTNAFEADATCTAGIPNSSVTESTPTSAFTDNGDGTVTHSLTGLIWKQCAEGLSGASCEIGSATPFSWANALLKAKNTNFSGHTDWRLPNKKELESIVEYCGQGPAINTALFPASQFPTVYLAYFWSGSSFVSDPSNAWNVNFNYGITDYSYKTSNYYVRLVRGGQSFGSFDAQNGVFSLTVIKTGAGAVSDSILLSCGSTCAANYGSGLPVTLTATPSVNFTSWGGACSGTVNTCTITMDAAKSVTANFKNLPIVSVASTSLSFATQNVGTISMAQTIALTNTGSASLNIASIIASGDYSVTHNCGTGLGAGGFCNLNITFTPTAAGTRTGSVTITDDAFDSPQTITLSGTGQGAVLSLSTTTLSFANQGVGSTSAPQAITLTNSGGEILNINSIVASGDFANTTTCGSTLAQGANCTINVTFSPMTAGSQSGSVVITSNSATSPSTITLSGSGVAVPLVSLNPTLLTFTTQNVGTTSSSQSITLSNTGGAALSLGSITANGDFSQSNNCGGGLGAGGSCAISVTFTPTANGSRTGTLSITDNASNSPQSVSLSGTGYLIPQTILFGTAPSVVVGGTGTVSATGGASGNAVTFSSTTSGVCTVSGNTVTGVIAGTCTIAANQLGNTNYGAATQATQNITIQPIYTISYNGNGNSGGTVPSDAGMYLQGAMVTVLSNTAMLTKTGYTFTGWNTSANGSGTSQSVASTFNMGSGNTTLYAQWLINTYSLTYTAGSNGSLSGSATQTVNYNASGTAVTALPATGYHFVNWSDASTTNPRTDSTVTANASVTANFAVNTFSLTYTAGSNGSLNGTSSQTVNYNASGSAVTAVPATGYHFVNWSDNSTTNPRTDYNVTSNVTISATFTPNAIIANLVAGWNLLGNSINAPLDVTTAFADASKVTTVWKWVPVTSKWAFYAPSLASAQTLTSYATGKGYDVLDTIKGGEGFWVNAKSAFAVQLPTGAAITASDYQPRLDATQNKLISGWNLIATGDNLTPSLFNQGLSNPPPSTGVIPLNITTLWAWDSGLSNWYFYSPSLEVNGGLANYISTKNYLDFTVKGKTLDSTTGFWVNKP
jgi:uncharacterized repeat protein (TIGR02543 family)